MLGSRVGERSWKVEVAAFMMILVPEFQDTGTDTFPSQDRSCEAPKACTLEKSIIYVSSLILCSFHGSFCVGKLSHRNGTGAEGNNQLYVSYHVDNEGP